MPNPTVIEHEMLAKVEVIRERVGDLLVDIWNDHRLHIDNDLDCDSNGRQLLATTEPEYEAIVARALAELAEQYDDSAKG